MTIFELSTLTCVSKPLQHHIILYYWSETNFILNWCWSESDFEVQWHGFCWSDVDKFLNCSRNDVYYSLSMKVRQVIQVCNCCKHSQTTLFSKKNSTHLESEVLYFTSTQTVISTSHFKIISFQVVLKFTKTNEVCFWSDMMWCWSGFETQVTVENSKVVTNNFWFSN